MSQDEPGFKYINMCHFSISFHFKFQCRFGIYCCGLNCAPHGSGWSGRQALQSPCIYSSCLEQQVENWQVPLPKHLLQTKHQPSKCVNNFFIFRKTAAEDSYQWLLSFWGSQPDSCMPRGSLLNLRGGTKEKQSFPSQIMEVMCREEYPYFKNEESDWIKEAGLPTLGVNTEIFAKSWV